MTPTLKAVFAAFIGAAGSGMAQAQAPEHAILDIEWENSVAYFDDVSDPSRLVTSPGPAILAGFQWVTCMWRFCKAMERVLARS